MLESGPPHSWMAWQASGMPGMDPAVGLAQGTPPPNPTATSPAAAGFREIKMARQRAMGRGSCFLLLPLFCWDELPHLNCHQALVHLEEDSGPGAYLPFCLGYCHPNEGLTAPPRTGGDGCTVVGAILLWALFHIALGRSSHFAKPPGVWLRPHPLSRAPMAQAWGPLQQGVGLP